MSDISFVRTEMLPEQDPPASTVGLIGWLRENLFSGWFNSILSLVSIYVIYVILSGLLSWAISPTWGAHSLNECREILAGLGREGHYAGACWGVISERWLQLMFGFYPPEHYWRVILAFVLVGVGLAPVLFDKAPRALLWFTPIFPFAVAWLLWGGTIWGPLVAMAGFVVGYFAYRFVSGIAGGLLGIIAAFAAPVIWWLFLAGPVAGALGAILPIGIEAVESRQFGGFMLSVTIGITAILISLPLGIVLALGRQSNLFIVKALCVGFIEFIRGVPLITLLFVASTLLNIFMPPGTNFDIILRVIIMVTLFAAAYMAEVIRGGLAALPKGQYEGADSLGLNYWQAQRLIIMPQALKISIPGIVSTFIGVFKDTTLVSIIGLLDPLGLSNAIRADTNWNGIVWEIYGFIALVFFIFCFSMSRYSMYLERKLQTGHH
ncbi:Inner membrane amino-acid ABC transporter permease protein YhdY [Pseudoruegeria aquimaris]|uniref:Inner membrane amino-acid ABC transporter permease protein YhdY n=1 Tax=Pseudoruegeria aquimaris TaxID=393663 RepID=A0A1Y5SEK4_9RHOB|nr:amino acid ABC transporter permease [Pseudoruegeria aquimaris]SLN38196.1 Inner membrane amino-acid ABC transporter permease protein YhdY [Pseudoruegeria aquimaris]